MEHQQDRNSAYQPPSGNYPPAGYPPPSPQPPHQFPPYQPPYPQQPWGQPPPPSGYPAQGFPPPQQYPAPPPQGYPPQQAYPPQQGYPPPQGYPPLQRDPSLPPPGSPAMNGYPPVGPPQYQYPPPLYPPQQYPPQQQATYLNPGVPPQVPPPPIFHTSPPVAPQIIPTADIDTIYKACKGFGTDERALISVFGYRDGPTIDAIRAQYSVHTKRDLISTLEKETSGYFRIALKGAAFGPVESEVFFTHESISGLGTNERMLTEAIMGKTNAEINLMKTLYPTRYKESLDNAVRGDLSMKTQKLFMMALSGTRMDDWVPINPEVVSNDTVAIHNACKGFGTDDLAVCNIITRSSDAHIRAIAYEYQRNYSLELTRLIKKDISGHMQDALLYTIEGALNKPQRDARLLEDSMKGLGTRDDLLISRLIRAHWNKTYFDQVKAAYQQLYGRDLKMRVKGETSGDYGRLMVALCA